MAAARPGESVLTGMIFCFSDFQTHPAPPHYLNDNLENPAAKDAILQKEGSMGPRIEWNRMKNKTEEHGGISQKLKSSLFHVFLCFIFLPFLSA